jgi:hypothetical protein
LCAWDNPKTERPLEKGTQYIGDYPLKDWKVDHTQMPTTTENLVPVDIFSR